METDHGHRKRCYRINEPFSPHFVTFSCFRRQPLLAFPLVQQYLCDAVTKARGTLGFHLWAYVLMPEHAHFLLWHPEPVYPISNWLRSVKQSTARRVVRHAREHDSGLYRSLRTGHTAKPHALWMEGGGYDRNVRDRDAIARTIAYIHSNPVRRRLSDYPEDWALSSARDWAGLGPGPIPLDKETLPSL